MGFCWVYVRRGNIQGYLFSFFLYLYLMLRRDFLIYSFCFLPLKVAPQVRFLALLHFHPHQLASCKEASQNQLLSRD